MPDCRDANDPELNSRSAWCWGNNAVALIPVAEPVRQAHHTNYAGSHRSVAREPGFERRHHDEPDEVRLIIGVGFFEDMLQVCARRCDRNA